MIYELNSDKTKHSYNTNTHVGILIWQSYFGESQNIRIIVNGRF